MAVRTILNESDPILRKVCRAIETIDERTKAQVQDLIDTLDETENGIGLAAPQVGLLKRVFVIDMREGDGPMVFINPEIVETSGEQIGTEGCLSIPGVYGNVRRPAVVRVSAQNLDGERFELEATGLFAVCICHENDHLNGVLFTDKVEGELVRESNS